MKKTSGLTFTVLFLITFATIICSIPLSSAASQPSGYYIYLLQNPPYNQALSYNLIIITKDASNETVPIASTVSLNSSDTSAIFPKTINILDTGVGSCTLYFGNSGNQTLTVTDSTNGTIKSTLTVNIQPIYFYATVTPATITAGQSVNVTVRAVDQTNNTLTSLGNQGYGATLNFSSTDTQAQFPPVGLSSKLVSGVGVFNITLNTTGPQTITITNRDFPAIHVTTNQITVNPIGSPTPSPTQTANPTETATPSSTINPTNTIPTTSTPDSTSPEDESLNQANTNQTITVIIAVVVVAVLAIVGLILYRKKAKQPSSIGTDQ